MTNYSPNRGKTMRGTMPSIKTKDLVRTASSTELDTVFLLEVQYGVRSYVEQPFGIDYWTEGVRHQYIPDFLVDFPPHMVLLECKPERLQDTDEIRRKSAAAKAYCTERGWIYKIVTDRHIRAGYRLDNARLLVRYGRVAVEPWVRFRVLAAVEQGDQSGQSLSIKSLAAVADPNDPRRGATLILNMIVHHELYVPLDHDLITPDSLVERQRGQDSRPFWDKMLPPAPFVHPAEALRIRRP